MEERRLAAANPYPNPCCLSGTVVQAGDLSRAGLTGTPARLWGCSFFSGFLFG